MARVMKDSGVAWIGCIPATWTVGRIGQLYTERKEKVSDIEFQPLSVTMKGVLPQLSTAAKTDSHDDRKLVRKGDFAINSRSDRRGSCGISPLDGSVSLINTILTPRDEMHPGYYDWLFHSTMFSDEFYKWGHGIVDDLWTTNWQDMKSILVPSPPLPEQSRIAAFLDCRCAEIDRVIAATQRTIEEYKKLKQSIITEAVTHGVRGPRKMKDSGVEWIGEIPEEWSVTKTKSLASRIVVGVVIKPADHFSENGTVPFLRGINVKEYAIIPEPMVFITEETNQMLSKSIVHSNDLLIVRDGSIGTACVVPDEFDGSNVVSMIIITCDKGISPQFICYSLNSDVGKTQFNLTKIGSALTHTSVQSVSNILHVMPPLTEQIEIIEYLVRHCNDIDRLIEAKQHLLTELESYKKSVIYEYVTGKQEVPQ